MHDRAESLLDWWTQQGRDGIPYGIWIAEVMLHFATQKA